MLARALTSYCKQRAILSESSAVCTVYFLCTALYSLSVNSEVPFMSRKLTAYFIITAVPLTFIAKPVGLQVRDQF